MTNAGIAETSKARPNRHQRPSRLPRRASTTEVQPPQLNAVSEWAACDGYKRIKTSPAAEDGLHSHLRAQRKPALTTMGAGKMPRKKGSHRDASIGLVRRRGQCWPVCRHIVYARDFAGELGDLKEGNRYEVPVGCNQPARA